MMLQMGYKFLHFLKILYVNFVGIVLFVSVPTLYCFQCGIVKTVLLKEFQADCFTKLFHYLFLTYLFANLFGNLLMFLLNDSTLKQSMKEEGGNYCAKCRLHRPADCWHCSRCRVCVLGRDHHCHYFLVCVGMKNQRYFMLGLIYANITVCYNLYFNYYYAVYFLKNMPDLSSIYLRFLANYSSYLPSWVFSATASYWLVIIGDLRNVLLVTNATAAFWVFYVAQAHALRILKGTSVYERRRNLPITLSRTKFNLVRIFGRKWYFAILWPFAVSTY